MNRLRTHALPVARFHEALNSALDALPDGELLARFAQCDDHPAFETLLRRHGAMVYGVCRRILANADADDAFQATFLILIRKARSLRSGQLGPWLYGVACRVAMKARSRAARFAEFRAEVAEMIPDPTAPVEVPDWLPILDAELAALPAKYRDALVLCELQGASRAEAAKALGVREGTLSSRLARGRELLRKRLLKHGTLLPNGGLVALLSENGAGRASVPAALLSKTSELSKMATGASAGAVPVGAARLTDEVLKSMFLMKLRVASVAGLAALMLVVGAAAAAWSSDSGAAAEQTSATKGMTPPETPGDVLPLLGAKPPEWGAIRGLRDLHFAGERDKRTALPDREAFQGLWVLEKLDSGKDTQAGKDVVGKIQLLVAGDVWWFLDGNKAGCVRPIQVKFDSAKNPKWIDMSGLDDTGKIARGIYEFDGDKLRICMSDGSDARPAEFATGLDSPLSMLTFGHGKMPVAVGEKTLLGSWEGAARRLMEPEDDFRLATQRVEVLDGYLFAQSSARELGGEWFGGKYTVDATKNPKWIDVELIGGLAGDDLTRLYGCYEVADGRLKLALGSKRATRPLEFKDTADTLFFDLKATKEPLRLFAKGGRAPILPPPSPSTSDSPSPGFIPPGSILPNPGLPTPGPQILPNPGLPIPGSIPNPGMPFSPPPVSPAPYLPPAP